jgi:hypothetical protein
MPSSSKLAPLRSSFSADIAMGELVKAGGKSRAEGEACTVGDEVPKKGGTGPATDIYMAGG